MHIYVFLRSSLTYYALYKVIILAYEYTCNGTYYVQTFRKVFISTPHAYTRTTFTFLHEKISSLDTCIVSIDSNIQILNDYFKTMMHALTSIGETLNDLLINLFKGYRVAKDNVFVAYIENKKDQYNE